ncbi:MAG: hypothetical protein ACJZ12_05080 [Candidatus Neomarinimicrobiota bacterium]
MSDSNVYLSKVKVMSLPSSTITSTDTSGLFSFDVPIKDRKISFELDGYLSDTLDVILFINNKDVHLIELIEVDYLDSIDTAIKFIVSKKEENILEYDFFDMSVRGLSKIRSMIYLDNLIIIDKKMNGSMHFNLDGISNEKYDVLYNNVKINNIDNCLANLTPISERGLSKLIITDGGFSKLSAISESMDFFPNNSYRNQLSIGLSQGSQENNVIDAFGSMGLKFVNINGGLAFRDNVAFFSDTSYKEIKVSTENYFSNIVLKNMENFELFFMGFQNNEKFHNPNNYDTLSIIENNIITKIDQWSPLMGKISLFGLYQDRNGSNYNQLDSIQISDRSRSLGFLLEKDLKNQLYTISASSILVNSNWNLINGSAIIDRQNYLLTGSAEFFLGFGKGKTFIRDLKMVYSKERTTDVMATNSMIQIPPNYWDDESYQLSTTIIRQFDDKKTILYAGYGISTNTPYLEDIIKYNAYSNLYDNEVEIYPEKKYSFNLRLSHFNKLNRTKGYYLIRMKYFSHLYKHKLNYLPLLGNVMTLPDIVGNAKISGIGIGLEFQPYTNNLRFRSDILSHQLSDTLKFYNFPTNLIKNQVLFKYRNFNLHFTATSKGNRYVIFMDESNQRIYSKVKSHTLYDIQLSKGVSYKFINMIISCNVHNLNNHGIFIGGIRTNDRKYLLELSLLLY